jgi:uncharacterized membrane protein
MKIIENGLLILHIAAGFSALISGVLVLALKKGTKWHINLGTVFYYAMLLVGMSALLLSGIKGNVFLFCIGIFSTFQTYFGKRSITNKSLNPSVFDWIITSIGFLNGLFMLQTGNVVLIVFGAIQVQLTLQLFYTFYRIFQKKPLHPKAWLKQHIGMMMGSFIATFTAFLVVNIQGVQPEWLIWIAPTALLVPLMVFWTRKFAK